MPTEQAYGPSRVDARVQYFAGCPHHRPAVERLRAVAERLAVPLDLHEVEVTPEDDPRSLDFRGSPTVLINGADVDPAVRDSGGFGFGCRTYGGSGVPSEAMLEAALKEAINGDAGSEAVSGPSAGDPDGDASSGPATGRSTFWAPMAALGTAGLAAACCWLPLLAVGLGLSLSIGGLIGAFEAARPYLLGVAGISLAIGFYGVYYRQRRCAPGNACASKHAKSSVASQAAVWGAAAAVIALALFPYYSGALIGLGSPSAAGSEAAVERASVPSNADTLMYEVEGMTCAGCEASVCAGLREVPGVEACDASYEKGLAWISPGSEQPKQAAIVEAIERAGFSVSSAVPNSRGSGNGERSPAAKQ